MTRGKAIKIIADQAVTPDDMNHPKMKEFFRLVANANKGKRTWGQVSAWVFDLTADEELADAIWNG